jgi:selenide, water dikinase
MCVASGLDAIIHYVNLPLLNDKLQDYIEAGAVPGGTKRNWNSYGDKVKLDEDKYLPIVADPQTSGGLLIAVDPLYTDSCINILEANNCPYKPIGVLVEKAGKDNLLEIR